MMLLRNMKTMLAMLQAYECVLLNFNASRDSDAPVQGAGGRARATRAEGLLISKPRRGSGGSCTQRSNGPATSAGRPLYRMPDAASGRPRPRLAQLAVAAEAIPRCGVPQLHSSAPGKAGFIRQRGRRERPPGPQGTCTAGPHVHDHTEVRIRILK